MNRRSSTRFFTLWLLGTLLMLAACGGNPGAPAPQQPDGGDPVRGLQVLQTYGCPACHAVPGVRGPKAWIGPPLINWAARQYVAGVLPNTPENLIYWIRYPQDVVPGNAMPNLNVNEQDARDISAYLYTLRDE